MMVSFVAPSVVRASSGDLNGSGRVDIFDFNLLISKFGNPYTIFDFSAIVANFGKTVSPSPSPTSTPTPSPTQSPTSPPTPQTLGDGIWISQSDLMTRPTSGPAWEEIVKDAASSWGAANVSDQDSNHDQKVLAGSLVCARTGQYCDKTIQGLLGAIDTENGARWLAIGRNVLSYTIAADLMQNSGRLTGSDLSRVRDWLARFLTRTHAHNNSGAQIKLSPFGSGSNASAQEGGSIGTPLIPKIAISWAMPE
jgi:hypothetical protein